MHEVDGTRRAAPRRRGRRSHVYRPAEPVSETTIPSWAHEGGATRCQHRRSAIRERLKEDQDRFARLVEHHRGGRRMGRDRAGEIASNSANARFQGKT
jgi:hypothetical protein